MVIGCRNLLFQRSFVTSRTRCKFRPEHGYFASNSAAAFVAAAFSANSDLMSIDNQCITVSVGCLHAEYFGVAIAL